jgi:hypothetical protein
VPSPQKAKGSNWERDVARQLSSIYGETFIRVPGSGAYVGGLNSARKEFLHEGTIRVLKGDIVPPLSFPRFNAECKSYKEFPWHQLYSGDCKVLDGWITQCLDAADSGDVNLLFMKFNRIGTFLAFEQAYQDKFLTPSYTYYSGKNLGTNWIITELGTFLENKQNTENLKEICSSTQ